MTKSQSMQQGAPDPAIVLSKAVVRAAENLHLSQVVLGKILGLSSPTVSRLHKGAYVLSRSGKEWELAALFIRAFRSLDSIVGNDDAARRWLHSQNTALNGRPIDMLGQTEGLVRVVHYLDASRAVI